MIDTLFSFPAARQRLHVEPLCPHIDHFAEHLLEEGYAAYTVVDKLRVVTKFSRWLQHHKLGIDRG